MEKQKTLTARAYRLLSCHKDLNFVASKEHEESLSLQIRNDDGNIRFTIADLTLKEDSVFDNPSSGEYCVPLKKGNKIRVLIEANNAIGSYKIVKKTSMDEA